jgi:hypothetical protein
VYGPPFLRNAVAAKGDTVVVQEPPPAEDQPLPFVAYPRGRRDGGLQFLDARASFNLLSTKAVATQRITMNRNDE